MRVLSIDGGGIRDLVAGTSTGGILACALTAPSPDDPGRPRFSAEELSRLYETEGPNIFSRSLLKRITSAEGLIDERYDELEEPIRAAQVYDGTPANGESSRVLRHRLDVS